MEQEENPFRELKKWRFFGVFCLFGVRLVRWRERESQHWTVKENDWKISPENSSITKFPRKINSSNPNQTLRKCSGTTRKEDHPSDGDSPKENVPVRHVSPSPRVLLPSGKKEKDGPGRWRRPRPSVPSSVRLSVCVCVCVRVGKNERVGGRKNTGQGVKFWLRRCGAAEMAQWCQNEPKARGGDIVVKECFRKRCNV